MHASPFNWTLLSLGGRTDVTLTGPSSVFGANASAQIGIAETGNLTLTGPSKLNGGIFLNTAGKLTRCIASFKETS